MEPEDLNEVEDTSKGNIKDLAATEKKIKRDTCHTLSTVHCTLYTVQYTCLLLITSVSSLF